MLLDKTEPNQIIFNLIECQLHLHVNLNAKSHWSNLDKWWISTRRQVVDVNWQTSGGYQLALIITPVLQLYQQTKRSTHPMTLS